MNGRRLPFCTALLMLVLGSLVCTVGAIGASAYFSASNAAQDLKERHYKLVSEATSLEVRRLLEPVPRILLEYRTLARRGMLPIDDPAELGKLLAERLRTRTFLGWISYSDRETGRFIGAWRREDGAIVINRSRPDMNDGRPSEWIVDEQGVLTPLEGELPGGYVPRTRPWFRHAIESNNLVWSEPYVFQEGQPGITASISFRSPGSNEPAGVFTADFFLTDISSFLHNLAEGKRGIVAVLTPEGDVIGSASSLEGDESRLFQAMRAATPLTSKELRMDQASRFGFERDGVTYDGVATAFTMGGGLEYIVTVVCLEDDKFMGDGAMALFNAPNDLPQHALHACRAALQLLQRIEQAPAFSEENGLPVIRIRIGVHTGEALVGNIGSNERFSYTALGDSVNLCARLELLNKSYGTRILVSETTYHAAKDHFEFRHIDRVTVTGRTGPNNVYELLAKKGELNSVAIRARDAYEEGLRAFQTEDFGAATVSFHSAHELQPQDAATAVMLARVSQAGVATKPERLEKTEDVYRSARNS